MKNQRNLQQVQPVNYDFLLKKTSRSFYLTLHALPKIIRWPISLAYLLARSTDTVADELLLPPDKKLALLNSMQAGINHQQKIIIDPSLINQQLSEHSPTDLLLIHFNELIHSLYQLPGEIRGDIITLLNTIIKGQELDIVRFSGKKHLQYIKTVTELNHYTYYVAGSVGEFWTKLCLSCFTNYSDKDPDELFRLATSFGQGLQLVNILRDLPQDIAHKRCYLPKEQIVRLFLPQENLAKHINLLQPLVHQWSHIAEGNLLDGWAYILSLKHRRLRATLILPVLLGFATLDKLKTGTYLSLKQPIKVSKGTARIIMFLGVCGFFSTHLLKILVKLIGLVPQY